jgi:DNA replication protein DnaC
VIDEVGYLNYGPDAAYVLFHVVNDRHILKRPIIFTTNKSPFSEWDEVLHDKDLAEAIVERILGRGRLIILDGPSARTRHLNIPEAHDSPEKAAIISVMDMQEHTEFISNLG